ncbi:Hypothetical protein A7982_07417 [Minicystis rosea]|nr:Hypothetical protein A7982_07417 [Minicystis rosea]
MRGVDPQNESRHSLWSPIDARSTLWTGVGCVKARCVHVAGPVTA